MIRLALGIAAFGIAALGLAASSAVAADAYRVAPAYAPPVVAYHPVTPGCNDGKMLSDISSRFAWSLSRTWQVDYRIAGFDQILETRLEPRGPGLIERRYCEAWAFLNTGEPPRKLFYLIESDQGFAGVGSRVEFCVEGFDPWRVHDGRCRTVRPPR
jgi:hypothetical protein